MNTKSQLTMNTKSQLTMNTKYRASDKDIYNKTTSIRETFIVTTTEYNQR